MASAPIFYTIVTQYIFFVIVGVAVVVEIVAMVHCATRKASAFPAVGSVPKGGWVAMTAGAFVLTALFGWAGSAFGAAAVALSLVYLLDVRPALRDAVDGTGGW
ncbi:MAG TPA: DUF2516 family protein [Micromonosporaceae bacterium]|jgi:hypothetical protein|nr:DUF2516 family protein [Micromonosporaceae bacterium]